MPAVIALAIRSLIQMSVTLGIIDLAEKFALPLINRGIEAIMEFFGVSEDDAKDIMSNEIILFAENVGVGALTLRSKLPTKIAERLGFTTKGFGQRALTGKAAAVKKGATIAAPIQAGVGPVPTATEATRIITAAKSAKPGFAIYAGLFIGALGTIQLAFMNLLNLTDFGNWNSGAYQKTFQRIFAKITGGLLVPDEDYNKTKTVSPSVFDKVYNTYKEEGAIAINDPYKRLTTIFNRDDLIDLLDKVGADLLLTKQRASTKDVLLISQQYIVFPEQKEAPAAQVAVAQAATLPKVKVFTGVLTQGKLGAAEPFVARETDLIDSMQELQTAAENNLSQFIISLPGRIIYEIKIVSSITDKDGFKHTGAAQRIITGYTTAGIPKYKTIINKFATIDIYVFTSRNVKTKIQTIVLGPVDSVAFQPKVNELQIAEQTIKTNITTIDINEVKKIITDQPPEIIPPALVTPPSPAPITPVPVFTPTPSVITFSTKEQQAVEAAKNLKELGIALGQSFGSYSPQDEQAIINLTKQQYQGNPAGMPQLYNYIKDNFKQISQVPVAAEISIPPSNNPNKCFVGTIAEFFDVNKIKYPTVAERSKLYEAYGFGPASWYTGTAEQNVKLLTEFKRRSGC